MPVRIPMWDLNRLVERIQKNNLKTYGYIIMRQLMVVSLFCRGFFISILPTTNIRSLCGHNGLPVFLRFEWGGPATA